MAHYHYLMRRVIIKNGGQQPLALEFSHAMVTREGMPWQQ